jgi:tRNA pseudouridine38-40 synthase
MRFFLKLSYDGTLFHGWQSQPNANSVQSTIEKALSTILRQQISIVGAGRTDTGVHAKTMYAHFDVDSLNIQPEKLAVSLNRLCGKGITINNILPVTDDAHARFDATSRTYKYFAYYGETPFLTNNAWKIPYPIDVEKMNEAAEILLQTEDFTSFAKLHSDAKTNICNVTEAQWSEISLPFAPEGECLVFTIRANRFLRNMVRAVVGTLVDVGRGKLTLDEFRSVIDQKNRSAAGTSMPPYALYLWDVEYPQEIFL